MDEPFIHDIMIVVISYQGWLYAVIYVNIADDDCDKQRLRQATTTMADRFFRFSTVGRRRRRSRVCGFVMARVRSTADNGSGGVGGLDRDAATAA